MGSHKRWFGVNTAAADKEQRTPFDTCDPIGHSAQRPSSPSERSDRRDAEQVRIRYITHAVRPRSGPDGRENPEGPHGAAMVRLFRFAS